MLLHATVRFNKVIYFLHNNSFCSTFGANVYSQIIIQIEECWLCAVVRGI